MLSDFLGCTAMLLVLLSFAACYAAGMDDHCNGRQINGGLVTLGFSFCMLLMIVSFLWGFSI